MINQDFIRSLVGLDDASFHLQFERKIHISSVYRTRFKNDSLLRRIREAYLDEFMSTQIESNEDKMSHLELALHKLTNIEDITQLDNEKILFICHNVAKIHYQIGVIWLNIDKEIDSLGLEKAFAAFQKAKDAYLPFRNKLEQFDDKNFLQTGCHLHQRFKDFDSYSPLARLIAIHFNLLTCTRYSSTIAEDREIVSHLEHLLTLEYDEDGSESHKAIQDVMTKYQEFNKESEHHRLNSKKNKKEIHATAPSAKRQKKSRPTLNPITWFPRVHSAEQLQSTFTESQVIPAFLRPRQVQDMQAIYRALHSYHRPLLVTKPTGTGKTAEFVSLANHAFTNGLPSIIVVPTTTLAAQTKQKFLEYKTSSDQMAYESNDIGVFCPTLGFSQIAPITIVTQASYVSQVKKTLELYPNPAALAEHIAETGSIFTKEVLFHPDFYSLLIIDEGHHVEGERLYEIVSREGCLRPKVLFSASTMPGEYERIDRLCQRVVTQTIQEAIIAGELSPLQMMNIDFSMYPEAEELTMSIRRRLRDADDVDIEEEVGKLLHSKIGFSYTALGILKQIFERVTSTKKVMIFTDSIDHADVLANMISIFFRQPTRSYHSRTPDRDAVIEHFKTTPRSMIVAVGALDEGFDDPDVNLILDFSTYRERIRRMMQRIGRAERVRADGSSAIIINVKILSDDLQLMPRDVILPALSGGYLGLQPDQVLQYGMVDLSLPPSIHITHTIGGETRQLNVEAQGAKIVFPLNNIAYNIGQPPVSIDLSTHSIFNPAPSSSIHTTSAMADESSLAFASSGVTEEENIFDNFDFDLLFNMYS